VEIAAPCSADWDHMKRVPGSPGVRWCDECRLNVYDLSKLDRIDALELIREHEGTRLCMRILRRRDGRVLTRDCPSGLRESAKAAERFDGSRLLGVGGFFGPGRNQTDFRDIFAAP
jgi:hypothetical protein